MALLEILEFPDPRLRTHAKKVDVVTPELKKLAQDMLETMYQAPGIGLAATQVNVHQRLLVIDISEEKNQPMVFFNPEILSNSGNQEYNEGCLSVPGFYEPVERAEVVRVRALGLDGEPFELEAAGLLSVCLQHEMDHLDGKLFVDHISPLKRQRIKQKLEKQHKAASRKHA